MAEFQLTDETFEERVIKSQEPVLVDLWAPWCGPCRTLLPIMEEIAKKYDGKVKVAMLNTDENAKTPARFKISAIPTLLFFNGGKLVYKLIGVCPKAEIVKWVDAMVAG